MDYINQFYENLNIYYSLIVYDGDPPHDLITELEYEDFPVVLLRDIGALNYYVENHRMFVIHKSQLNELVFTRHNDLTEFNIIFCINNAGFDSVLNVLETNKPSSAENIFITVI